MKLFVFLLLIILSSSSCNSEDKNMNNYSGEGHSFENSKSKEAWKEILKPEEYKVLIEKGTEYPGTGEYNFFFEDGVYRCRACANKLFNSDTKFKSYCGWPSFYDIADKKAIIEIQDTSHNMIRTEVVCAKCGGHLGHKFDDGPNPTGLRYCINSVSIKFESKDSLKSEIK
ncbi:MAG TPA: peptide-methionine (R)-S-oxide reductase MsrB [Candidatus Kapabacteria bacterium]|nr:peptide-methionine (R)-S-oxide reductase MsrB [Candidatus Kapabacteria bacterium]